MISYYVWACAAVLLVAMFFSTHYTLRVCNGCSFKRLINILFIDKIEESLLRYTFMNIFWLRCANAVTILATLALVGGIVWTLR